MTAASRGRFLFYVIVHRCVALSTRVREVKTLDKAFGLVRMTRGQPPVDRDIRLATAVQLLDERLKGDASGRRMPMSASGIATVRAAALGCDGRR
jgi:hypothetical protein